MKLSAGLYISTCVLLALLIWLFVPSLLDGQADPLYASRGSWGQAYDDQWGLKRIGFGPPGNGTSAWDLIIQARHPVIVAVIDTGLDYSHPDLRPKNVWHNRKEVQNGRDDDGNGYIDDLIGWNFVERNNNPRDDSGHGTHVAGIIAAATGNGEGIAGINPRVKIMPLKILNSIGRGRATGLAEAILYAVKHGARVINLSIGGQGISKTERLAIDYARQKGVLVVGAAGNVGKDTAEYGTAGLPSAITVAATDQNDRRARFSGWGQAIDIAAPGVDVLSLRARGTDVMRTMGIDGYKAGSNFVGPEARYYRASGTSFAAAFVSGAASLLLSKNPNLTNVEVKRMLLMSADDVEAPGWDQLTGYGRLNVARALVVDPAFFLDARINRVEVVNGAQAAVLRVHGVADANNFKQSWIELGAGEIPNEWRKVSGVLRSRGGEGLLAELPLASLRGGDKWMLRLIVEHTNGHRREARHTMNVH